MKLAKRLFLGILFLSLLMVVFIGAVMLADRSSTGYLLASRHPETALNSCVITHVQVLPMTGDTLLRDQSVLIRDGVIRQISDSIAAEGLQVIDGQGKYLLPGLTDMHVHVWDQYELGLYLANGVTAVRNLWGRPMHLRMKRAVADQELLAPLFFTSGPKLTGPEFMGDDNLQLFSAEDARQAVRAAREQGYDFIKTYYGLPEDYLEAILEEAGQLHLDIVAHPTPKVSYAFHFKPGIASVEHAEDIVQQPLNYTLDTLKLEEVVRQFGQARGTSFCPTLTVYHNIYNLLEQEAILESKSLDWMNPMIRKMDSKAQFDRWANSKRNDPGVAGHIQNQHNFHLLALKRLHQAGVNIVCGTDAGIGITVPGASIHEELAFYKEAGLSNYEVLKTATVNPSKVHGFLGNLGTVEPGKTANLLLVEDNPLEHLATLKNPTRVFVRGRGIGPETLALFREKAANRPNLLASFLRYAEYLALK